MAGTALQSTVVPQKAQTGASQRGTAEVSITQTLHGTAIYIYIPISWGGARGVNGAAYMAVPLVVFG